MVTEKSKRQFLCVEADGKRCAEQCWQCRNIQEFEEGGEPPEDDSWEDTNVEDSDAR